MIRSLAGWIGAFHAIGGVIGPAWAQVERPMPRAGVVWTAMPIRSDRQVEHGMKGGEGGQCLHGIARCAGDDRRVYLAVDVVGVWRSKDGGASWEPCRNAGLRTLGTSSVAVHPRDPDRVFVYAQAAWEKPREAEEGLYMSMDSGETWIRAVEAKNGDARRGYRHLIDVAADGRRVYFAAFGGGVYRSDNGGLDWMKLAGVKDAVPWEIRTDPRDSMVVWLGTDEGLHVSRNGGQTFEKIKAIDGNVSSVTLDPQKAGRLYVVLHGEGLYRSEDEGKTIKHLGSGDRNLDRTARVLFQSPVDPRRLILAGDERFRVSEDAGQTWREPRVDLSRSFVTRGGWGYAEGMAWGIRKPSQVVGALACGMFASNDNGLTWTDSGAGYTGFHHGWSDGAVSFAVKDPKRVAFFCYDYAFNLTTDGGRTFRNGRLKEQVRGWWGMYAGDMSPAWEKEPVVVAAAGNYWKHQLVRSEDGGRNWKVIADTDGAYFFVRFHPEDVRVVYADDRRSDDGGRTYRRLKRPVYAYAPSRPDTVYGYGEGKVWRSDDRGETWRALPDPPRKAGEWQGRRDMEVDPQNPEKVWVMTPPDCAVFDGKAWRLVEASKWASPRAHAFVSRMAIDPGNAKRVIVGLDAIGESYLFMSEDGGETWADITGNLPRLGSNQSLNIQPGTGRVFIGAGFGTWTMQIAP